VKKQSIQSKGGKARAANLSAKERSEISTKAANVRWSKSKKKLKVVASFSPEDVKLVQKIKDDISTMGDTSEPRSDVVMAVSYFSHLLEIERIKRIKAETSLAEFRAAKDLMDSALS
jgi:hypothetical protein